MCFLRRNINRAPSTKYGTVQRATLPYLLRQTILDSADRGEPLRTRRILNVYYASLSIAKWRTKWNRTGIKRFGLLCLLVLGRFTNWMQRLTVVSRTQNSKDGWIYRSETANLPKISWPFPRKPLDKFQYRPTLSTCSSQTKDTLLDYFGPYWIF